MQPLDSDDVLAQFVHFISSTESRNKIYRLIQYGAKMSKWVVMTTYELKPEDLKQPVLPSAAALNGLRPTAPIGNHKQAEADTQRLRLTLASETNSVSSSKNTTKEDTRQRARWLAGMLSRVELLFGDARKVYRLFQFLEMVDLFRHVDDPESTVRLLRRLRVLCFFFFYLFENYMVFLLRIEGFATRHPLVVFLKRSCNGFWCASILLAFALDHVTKRGTVLSTVKKLLDLPVAYIAFADKRVSDGVFGLLGIASAEIGVYLRWVEVMAKLRHKKLLTRAGGKLLGADVA